jgi:flagellar motility protein MotE (MotC chaperone)
MEMGQKMNRNVWAIVSSFFMTFFVIFLLSACGQRAPSASAESAPSPAQVSAPMSNMSEAKMAAADAVESGGAEQSLTKVSEPGMGESGASANGVRKYLALRHSLQIETPAEKMQAAFDAAVNHCAALNCQMLSANFNKGSENSGANYIPPFASLSVRVPPRNVEIFLAELAKNGEILQHGRDSEDKTNQVLDADARIKNLTELRDRYRVMLTEKKAEFKDLVEIEKALAQTQSELDSIISIRKVLSQETDLVAVNIDFTAARGVTEQGFFAPVASAFKNAGTVMMDSLATLINFIMSVIPWLVIGLPLIWVLRKVWAKIRGKH